MMSSSFLRLGKINYWHQPLQLQGNIGWPVALSFALSSSSQSIVVGISYIIPLETCSRVLGVTSFTYLLFLLRGVLRTELEKLQSRHVRSDYFAFYLFSATCSYLLISLQLLQSVKSVLFRTERFQKGTGMISEHKFTLFCEGRVIKIPKVICFKGTHDLHFTPYDSRKLKANNSMHASTISWQVFGIWVFKDRS